MNGQFWTLTGWVLAAAVLGFAISAVFAGGIHMARQRFLFPYILLGGSFVFGFFTLNSTQFPEVLVRNWGWGAAAGLVVSVFLIRNVGSQPASRDTHGTGLVLDLAWSGLGYGLLDAFFLNVMPVLAVHMACSQFAWAGTFFGKMAVGAFGLLASLLVTLAYHLGYPEYRNRQVLKVLLGNGVITLAFLLSGNPLGSLISHTIMHIAAVLQGPETTLQLPPHYQTQLKPG